MKKYRNLLLGLAGALALGACSSDEPGVAAPGAQPGGITVNVVTSDAFTNRAAATVDGYTLKCVMQLMADDGTQIGSQSVIDAAAGSAQFVITPTDIDNGATHVLFWAEYVPAGTSGAPKVYDSADLTSVKVNPVSLTKAQWGAADAFAGTLDAIADGATVTLTRPLSKVTFMPSNPADAHGQSSITVRYDAPTAYNVQTRTVADPAESAAVTLTDTDFDPMAEPWFEAMILCPENITMLDSEIVMELSGRIDQTITIPAGKIPTDPNKIVKLSAEISEEPSQDINISVGIGDLDYTNDPDRAVEMKVGSYIRADGRATLDPRSAIGIVFAMEAIGGDVPANYPAQFHGKTIKAYAVALENTAKRTNLSAKDALTGFTYNNTITNGTQYTATMLEALGSDSKTVAAFNDWISAHPLSGADVTEWYIPTGTQLETWLKMLASVKLFSDASQTVGPEGSADFRALFPESNLFDRTPAAQVKYLSCSVNSGNLPSGCTIAPGDPITGNFGQFSKPGNPCVVRPFLTIFE